MTEAWTRKEFEEKLKEKGRLYHIHHPYQVNMNSGKSNKAQIQGWVANRFYYQTTIPIKDASIMANCSERDVRRQWMQRILDHDGVDGDDGGIEAWLRLGESVGMSRQEILSQEHVLPGVRFACDAYLNFARRASWQEAACSSLTELFAPEIHQKRLNTWPDHYPWIDIEGYQYFRKRLSEARRDVQHGLDITLEHFKTREQQEQALSILQFKLEVLWSMLDAMQIAYVYVEPPFHSCPELRI
ncbi:pyrroloquinoline-quinone synthase PqqC [Gammaproteobacteria bacterium]|jgi:pyrroloquinoline-quinone synthase|nr:pyrroloquinoline-quinone synthase PqqC [Gammaproteobacteria bacterium]|tara:strand:- start:398 stop:1126 length:729 start_codon:yes stop_codon:yes gene_type:complete